MLLESTTILIILSLMLSGLCCLMAAYFIYKVRQVHVTLYGTDFIVKKLSTNVTQNLQNTEMLTYELGLKRPLPALRGWVASPDVLLALTRHVRRARPSVIFECGSGASTLVLAQAVKLNGRGRIYSIDHDAEFAQRTREMLDEYGLSDWAEVTYTPLRPVEIAGTQWQWYAPDALPATPPIDLLFIDGPPAPTLESTTRYPAGPMLFPRLAPGASVFADDTRRPGETEVLRRWASEFPHLAQQEHFCEKGCHELKARRAKPEEVPHLVIPDAARAQRISSS
jgi:predicted O-methyltransferase YrrM